MLKKTIFTIVATIAVSATMAQADTLGRVPNGPPPYAGNYDDGGGYAPQGGPVGPIRRPRVPIAGGQIFNPYGDPAILLFTAPLGVQLIAPSVPVVSGHCQLHNQYGGGMSGTLEINGTFAGAFPPTAEQSLRTMLYSYINIVKVCRSFDMDFRPPPARY